MPQTELASANRVTFLEQLSASIGEINQPVCAVVINAEVALRLLLAQPTDTEAVRRLLARIVKDGLRTGDMVHRARALIKENAATEGMPGINAVTLESMKKLSRRRAMNTNLTTNTDLPGTRIPDSKLAREITR